MAALDKLLDFRKGFLLNGDRHHFVPLLPGGGKHEQRKTASPGNQAIFHLTIPRSELSMKASSSRTCSPSSTSSRIFSTAFSVFNPDFVRTRNAL